MTMTASPDGKAPPPQDLYQMMRLIRRFEERAMDLVRSGDIVSGIHPCIGQEAVAAGTGAALRRDDIMLANHRAHGQLLAKGSDPAGCSPRWPDASPGSRAAGAGRFIPPTSPSACSARADRSATAPRWRRGPRGRSPGWAATASRSASSATAPSTRARCSSPSTWPRCGGCLSSSSARTTCTRPRCRSAASVAGSITGRAEAFGIPAESVDGMDPETVYAAMARGVARARAGEGPTFLEFRTYRFYGHHTFEDKTRLRYRDPEEVARWQARDPLALQAGRVPEGPRSGSTTRSRRPSRRPCGSPWPARSRIRLTPREYLYASGCPARPGVAATATTEKDRATVTKLSYLRALNRALGDEMERDPAVFVLGEDVRHALTNVTVGLFDRFGPQRVVETPISEQGFTNFATGAAMAGLRPVVEYQIPFLLMLVFEQIVNQANKFSADERRPGPRPGHLPAARLGRGGRLGRAAL